MCLSVQIASTHDHDPPLIGRKEGVKYREVELHGAVEGGIRPEEKIRVEEGNQLERAIYPQIVEQARIIRRY